MIKEILHYGGKYNIEVSQPMGYTSWEAASNPAQCGFVTWQTGEPFEWTGNSTDGYRHESIKVTFPDNKVNLKSNNTYYAVLWTKCGTVYPDDIITNFSIENGQIKNEDNVVLTITHDVKFYSEGNLVKTQTVQEGNKATPPELTKTGYTLISWKQQGGSDFNFNTGITSDITLNANWQINNYIVSYDSAGGEMPEGTPIQSYTVETPTTNLPAPTKTGYDFAGWHDSVSGNTITKIEKGSTGNKELTAQWTAKEYTLSYEPVGGTMPANYPNGYTIETDTITLPTPEKVGYRFKGWYDTTSGNVITELEKGSMENRELIAQWERIDYTISYDPVGGTMPEEEYATGYTVETETIELPIPEKAGYEFTGWKDNVTGNVIKELEKGSTENRELTAQWNRLDYTISYDPVGGTMPEEEYATGYTVETETIELPTPEKIGYSFKGWLDNVTGNVITELEKGSTENRELTAVWEADNYTITYETNGGTEIEEGSYTIETGEDKLPEPTKPGYDFDGWYDNEDFEGEPIEEIEEGENGDKILYAKWKEGKATYKVEKYKENLDGVYSEDGTEIIEAITGDKVTYEEAIKGFTIDKEHEGSVLEGIVDPEGKLVLKVYYKRDEHKITIDKNTGKEDEIIEQTKKHGDKLDDIETPTKPGYIFDGWETEDGKIFNPGDPIEGDMKLKARWKIASRKPLNPRTGDPIIYMIILFIISAIASTTIMIKNKNNKRSKKNI